MQICAHAGMQQKVAMFLASMLKETQLVKKRLSMLLARLWLPKFFLGVFTDLRDLGKPNKSMWENHKVPRRTEKECFLWIQKTSYPLFEGK